MAHGEGRIRTFEGLRRQIYSLILLATQEPHRLPSRADRKSAPASTRRADGESRTRDRLITNQVLYQLSYVSRQTFLRETRRIVERKGPVKAPWLLDLGRLIRLVN